MIRTKLGKLNIKNKPSKPLAQFDKEIPTSKYIPIKFFIAPDIFVTEKGELGTVIKLQGIPFEVQDTSDLNFLQNKLGFLIQQLGDEYAVYVTTYRHQQSTELAGVYPDGFIKDFTRAYYAQFNNATLFVNDIYLSILFKAGSSKTQKRLAWLDKIIHQQDPDALREWHEGRLRQFRSVLTNVVTLLEPYSAQVLGCKTSDNTDELQTAELLTFLSILVNGEGRDYTYPLEDIATFVPEKRIYFGKSTLHFKGQGKEDDVFGAILSIKHYAAQTTPGFLNEMLRLPFETITTHSFLSLEKNHAMDLIERQKRRLIVTGDAAHSQIVELEHAKDDLASGRITFGFHHNTVLVLARDLKSLEEHIAHVIKIYQSKRLSIIRETLNLENAFWAQIPGNFKHIRRNAVISSNNFSCFSSLHNYYTGYIDRNHLGSALMLAETTSKTPFYFNLHEKASGRKDDLSKGHTLLIGPSNAGKTVILTTIDAMFKKYGARSIIFDRNYGCEIYVRACGGNYFRLEPGKPTGWNPCQLADTPKNRQFLREFIEVLSTGSQTTLNANDINQIAEVVERNFSIPFELRNLSNIASFFRLDFNGLTAFSRYTRLPDRTGRCGDRSYLFDNETDSLNLNNDMLGFDMTHWLSSANETPEELQPISMYLFHRIESNLDGRLTLLYADEGWQLLTSPYWYKKYEEFMVTARKQNLCLLLASQLPAKLAASPIAGALIQGTATQLFLANPKAEEADYMGSFKLIRKEFDIIKNTSPQSRLFLIKQGHEAAVVKFNLTGLEPYIAVLSGNEKSVALCQQIRSEVGDDPKEWLPVFYARREQ